MNAEGKIKSISVTEKKIALVIGNSNYKESPLKNPVHDADDIAESLESVIRS